MSDLAQALGKIPSGLFVLTASRNGRRGAMLASWVMQASFEPPAISVAINKERDFGDWMTEGTAVTLNILGEKNSSLIARFARGTESGEDPFEGLALQPSPSDSPILSEAAGFLCGKVTGPALPAGDHRIFLVKIEDGGLLSDDPPRVHVRKNGLRY